MGKECYRDGKQRGSREARKQLASYILKGDLQTEMAKNWSTREGIVAPSEVVEDGKVLVVLRQRGQDVKLLCSGFAKRDNPCLLLLRRLHERGLLTPGSALENVLLRRDSIWTSIDIRNSSFNSGDCFLLVFGPAQHHKSTSHGLPPAVSIQHKAIRKLL